MIHLDTHVAAWLYAGQTQRIPGPVLTRIEAERLAISPMVELELQYLFEVGRVTVPGFQVLDELSRQISLFVERETFGSAAKEALSQSWTRDPFDRLIVGHALASGSPLATADRTILDHCPLAFWG